MRYEKVELKKYFPGLPGDVSLTVYAQDNSPEIAPDRRRPAVVICPGGGYAFRSDREAEPIALALLARGYQAFILNYSVANEGGGKYPTQLLEAAAAFAFVRNNAAEYHVREDAVSVLGFSAGGHLSAMISTLWHEQIVSDVLGIPSELARPDAQVLCYPVISNGACAHAGSFNNLAGDDAALREKLSLETAVDANTPPAFIWHTWSDATVPVENSMLFASALRKNNVPFEMHIFPAGPHGLSLANEQTLSPNADRINPHAAVWFDLCDRWLKTMFSIRD